MEVKVEPSERAQQTYFVSYENDAEFIFPFLGRPKFGRMNK
jgi:hypothetical protein